MYQGVTWTLEKQEVLPSGKSRLRWVKVNQPPQNQRPLAHRSMPLSLLPRVVDVSAVRMCDPPGPMQRAAPDAPGALVASPDDLVARALAILTEEAEVWQARRAADLSPKSTR